MNLRRARILVDEGERKKRERIKTSVSRVLVTYPKYVLVKVNQDQINSLEKQGFRINVQRKQMIRLRIVEFDPSEMVPSPPSTLKFSDDEINKMRKVYWLVQFVGPVKPEWVKEIASLGGKLHRYISDNTFMVDMTLQTKEKVEKLSFVNWVGLYEPVYKISPSLMGRRKKVSPRELSSLSIIVEDFKPKPEGNANVILHDPADLTKVSRRIKKLGGKVVATGKDRIRASLHPSGFGELAKMAEVLWIEPYLPPELANDVAAQIIGVQNVWNNHGLDGDGQTIAVADTGLDTGVNDATMHDDFEGRIIRIYDRVGDGPDDVNSGHGTHVAGSVLGNGVRSNRDIRGMAFAARLIFQAIEDNATQSLTGIPADYNDLFQEAYDVQQIDKRKVKGARIHTNSWGDKRYGQYAVETQDIDDFVRKHKDMVILFCAHNWGRDTDGDGAVNNDSLSPQACAKNCITIGASENNRAAGGFNPGGVCNTYGTCWPAWFPSNPIRNDRLSDNPDGMVAFSSRGPTDDDRIKPDVVAPGTNILSVRSSLANGTGWGLLPAGDPLQPFYMYMGGTSMATPLVAGTVALIRQYLEKVCLREPTAALVKAILIHGARPMAGQYMPPDPSDVGPVPDVNQGWGRVNLAGSLFPDFPAKNVFVDDPNDVLETATDFREFSFNVVDGTVPFRATLVWTDYPSTVPAGGLINELSLSIVRPNGTIEYGPPNYPDIINNVQQVVIDNPQLGEYKVRVDAINIQTFVSPVAVIVKKQDFALVVSGGLEFVDVYIRDNDADNGVEPSTGSIIWSPDIWACLENDPNASRVMPKDGRTNYIFVKVNNRGTKDAENAEVKLFWAYRSASSQPNWKTDGIKVDGVLGNVQYVDVPAHSATGDGEAITAAFEWIPSGKGTFYLFATVNHPNDPLLQEDVDVVRWEDNLAQRYVKIKKRCLIATVASGSKLNLQVQFLRHFRDEVVLKSKFKNLFKRLEDFYYQFSPYIVRKMEEIPHFNKFIKYIVVYPFVSSAKAIASIVLAVRDIK